MRTSILESANMRYLCRASDLGRITREYCSTREVKYVKAGWVGFKKSNLGFRASYCVSFCKKCLFWFLATNWAVTFSVSNSWAERLTEGAWN